ncbi:hypothetical protein GF342_03460 [Candidatus Woesearchaeota archaeon]|nr:hypothetical protein [Candidatus Woesearchaeota archaeon]
MKRGIIVLLIFLLLFGVTVSAKRALNCSIDDCTGLTGLWHLDDGNEANVFLDMAGNLNGSCTTCPNWVEEGKTGGAYDFVIAVNKSSYNSIQIARPITLARNKGLSEGGNL